MALEGLDVVLEQLLAPVPASQDFTQTDAGRQLGCGEAIIDDAPPLGADAENIARPPAPPVDADNLPVPVSVDLEYLHEHYVFIYGTTTIYDYHTRDIIKLDAMAAALGRKLVDMWLNSPMRRTVYRKDVVFDPTGDANPTTTVNLFRGFPLQPVEGDCAHLLTSLNYLVGGDDVVFDWVLKWMAYPLQNPGAKMTTAIIMHGPEGTGKNQFWGALRAIYGEHAGIITQNELESQFNGWASAKLFVIGNEVVSRQEMYHQKGRVKNMISESEWMINEKHLPSRMEANHANFVFFSNVLQPMTPDQDDRRYLVVWTPPAREAACYVAVDKEMRSGGVAALYHYLMALDLGDFSEHSKPPMTEAKQDLIDVSMKPHERFVRKWEAGELPVAFGPCLTGDLYRVYRHYCVVDGEKFTIDKTNFSIFLKKIYTVKSAVRYHKGSNLRAQGTFLMPPDALPPADTPQEKWLTDQISQFAGAFDEWKGETA